VLTPGTAAGKTTILVAKTGLKSRAEITRWWLRQRQP
jgi:hypothetical protein